MPVINASPMLKQSAKRLTSIRPYEELKIKAIGDQWNRGVGEKNAE